MNQLVFQLTLVVLWNTFERLLMRAGVLGSCVYRDLLLFVSSSVIVFVLTTNARKTGLR